MTETSAIDVYLEAGAKRVFACALDWPGWCRLGKTEQEALSTLAAYASRYSLVAAEAGLPLPAGAGETLRVVERLQGNATTDFGAPAVPATSDSDQVTAPEAERLATLVEASWAILARVVAGAPAQLRKGPRGGGRDRDQIVDHVVAAEAVYARKLGLRQPQPSAGDVAAVAALRQAITAALRDAAGTNQLTETAWPVRYAARRIAWHAIDHAWEIEDKSAPAG